ncbi:YbaY family lipoprotein [Shewanella sp.]|uniref:YbaY family lipoprotein n=1 Tax=Shewanella sp. TaxID=50422 RepID=UPI003F3982F3
MSQSLTLNALPALVQKLGGMALLAVTLLLGGCATPNDMIEIKGEAMYRERIALPADAQFIVQLLDVSKMDAPAVVMAERVSQGARTPMPFRFDMGRDQFTPGHTYAIGARIMHGDTLLFINTQAYRVDLNSTEAMTILLEKVGR